MNNKVAWEAIGAIAGVLGVILSAIALFGGGSSDSWQPSGRLTVVTVQSTLVTVQAAPPSPSSPAEPAGSHTSQHPVGYAFLVALFIVLGLPLAALFTCGTDTVTFAVNVIALVLALAVVAFIIAAMVFYVGDTSLPGAGIFGLVLLWSVATLVGVAGAFGIFSELE